MVKDIVNGAVAVGLSLFVYFSSSAFEKGGVSLSENPALYPKILAGVVFCFGLILIVQAVLKGGGGEKKPSAYADREGLGRVLVILLLLCGYILGIHLTGFILPTLLFTGFVPLISGAKKRTSLLVSIPLTAVLYVVFFIFFKVPVPHGLLFG